MLSNTNDCVYGGNIQLTLEENDQFQIVNVYQYISNAFALDLNTIISSLIIERVLN